MLHQKRNALVLPLPQLQSFKRRLLQPGQIIAGKLAAVSQIAAGQENRQRKAAQEAANLLADVLVRDQVARPCLQERSGFIQRQRQQIAQFGRCIATPPGGDQNCTACRDRQNLAQIIASLSSVQNDQSLAT